MSRLSIVVAALFAIAIGGCENTAQAPAGSTADLEKRIKKLEDNAARHAEAMDFLEQQYKRIKAQQEQQEAQEPAEDAIFAVDITGNQFEGPKSGAFVTVIEAWDFA